MAGVYRRLNPRRVQLRRSWAGTHAVAGNVYTKSGNGIVGLPILPRWWPKSGYAIAGTVGSGASFKAGNVYTKTGYGVLGIGRIVTDDFNRSNSSSLGSNWTAHGGTDGQLGITSNKMSGDGSATNPAGDVYVGTFGNDQFSQITGMVISAGGGSGYWVGVTVRGDSTGQNGYRAIYFWNAATPIVRLYKRVSGTFTQLGSDYTIPGGNGGLSTSDVLRLEAVGTTITAYLRGVVAVQVTDSTYTSGSIGLMAFGLPTADDWQGGDLVAGNGLIGSGSKVYVPGGNVYTKAGHGVAPLGTNSQTTTAPLTLVLDNFNRANGSLGSNWSGPAIHPDALVIVSNRVTAPSSLRVANGFWNVNIFGPITGGRAVELYMQLTTVNTGGAGHDSTLIMVDNPTSSTANGYALVTNPFQDSAQLYSITAGTSTLIGNTGSGGASGLLTAGSWAWLIYRPGGILEFWVSSDQITWTKLLTVTDTTFQASSWYIGIQVDDNSIDVDNFGGGVVGALLGFKQVTHNRSGYGTVHGLGSGAKVYVPGAGNVYTKSGFGVAGGLIGAGPSASIEVDTGFSTVGGVGSGSKQIDHNRSGFGVAGGLIGSGSSASIEVDTGLSTVGGIGSGSKQIDHNRSGYATVGINGAGQSASVEVDTGFGTVGGVGSGAKQTDHIRSGYGTVHGFGSGPSASIFVKSGYATIGGIGSGPDTAAFARSGNGIIGLIGSGSSTHSGSANELGSGITGLIGAGSRAVTTQRTGNGITGLIGTGSRSEAYTKSGYATVGSVGSGTKQVNHNKSGSGAVSNGVPTILGASTKGSSGSQVLDRKFVSRYTLTSPATLTELHGWFGIGTFGSVMIVMYADSGGFPNARIAYTAPFPPTASDIERLQAGFSIPLAPGDYWLGTSSAVTSDIRFYSDAGAPKYIQQNSGGTGNPPSDPFGPTDLIGSSILSFWAVVNVKSPLLLGSKRVEHYRSSYGVAGLITSGPSASIFVKRGYAAIGCTTSGSKKSDHTKTGSGFIGQARSNWLPNGGSELNVTGWGRNQGTESVPVRDTTQSFDGAASCKIITSGSIASEGAQQFSAAGSFPSGGTVTIQTRVKATSGSVLRSELVFRTTANIAVGPAFFTQFVADGTWQLVTVTASFTDVTIDRISSKIRTTTALTDTIWIDAAQAESGPVANTYIDTSNGAITISNGLIGSGFISRAGQVTKTGFATAGGIGSGIKQVTHTKSGFATTAGVGSGSDTAAFTRAGHAVVGIIGSGSTSRVRTTIKSGFATAGSIGSGSRITEHPRSGYAVISTIGSGSELRGSTAGKSGYAVIGLVGSGLKQIVYLKSGYSTIDGNGSGTRQVQYTKSGYGEVGTTTSASVIRRTPFSIIIVGVHAYRHWTFNVIVEDTYMVSAHKHVTLARSGKHFFIARAFKHNTTVQPRELVYR